MNEANELWQLEEQFWLGGADFYERTLAPGALMVLPQPAGILDRASTVDSIRSGARWQNVVFKEQRHLLPDPGTAVLAYTVQADRGTTDSAYLAQCSSTYIRHDARWLLVLHHQTAADQDSGRS